jgi:hypothetical protein
MKKKNLRDHLLIPISPFNYTIYEILNAHVLELQEYAYHVTLEKKLTPSELVLICIENNDEGREFVLSVIGEGLWGRIHSSHAGTITKSIHLIKYCESLAIKLPEHEAELLEKTLPPMIKLVYIGHDSVAVYALLPQQTSPVH